jgi:predicted ribosomally synthesized peptide with SipW-like signal peptide
MKKSASKKALIASAAAISLSALLFAGTTYAWFTDSASSGISEIKSGNLDVTLQVLNANGDWVDVVADTKDADGNVVKGTDIFATACANTGLWEPGHTEVVYLKVTNAGSLALKYQLSVNKEEETTGTSVTNKTITLSEVLKYGLVTGDTLTKYTSRADAIAAAKSQSKEIGTFSDSETLNPGTTGNVQYVALIVYMPEETGNDANYTGTTIPSIDLRVELSATQAVSESDSFGSDYDDNAFADTVFKDNENGTYTYEDYTYVQDNGSYVQVEPTEKEDLYSEVDGSRLYLLWENEAVPVTSVTDYDGAYTDGNNRFYVYSEESYNAVAAAYPSPAKVVIVGDVSLGNTTSCLGGKLNIGGSGNCND